MPGLEMNVLTLRHSTTSPKSIPADTLTGICTTRPGAGGVVSVGRTGPQKDPKKSGDESQQESSLQLEESPRKAMSPCSGEVLDRRRIPFGCQSALRLSIDGRQRLKVPCTHTLGPDRERRGRNITNRRSDAMNRMHMESHKHRVLKLMPLLSWMLLASQGRQDSSVAGAGRRPPSAQSDCKTNDSADDIILHL